MAEPSPLDAIERIQVTDVGPKDIVILRTNAQLSAEEAQRVLRDWLHATELPNRAIVLTGGIEVELRRPECDA